MTGGGRKIDRKDVHTPRPCSIITQPSSDEKEVNLIDATASQGFPIDLALQTSILPSILHDAQLSHEKHFGICVFDPCITIG